MKRSYLAFILLLLSFSILAMEEDIQPQSQGDVTFISGGVGGNEQRAMLAMQASYNLNLLFTVQGTGEYLSDVKVTIADTQGNVFLDTVADGPKLFANLNAGQYIITANQNGRIVRKTATIGKHRTSLSFTWPQN